MIQITDKTLCCGCSACEQVCPAGCIQMTADKEGFLYPVVDTSKCIGCNKCEKVCAVLHEEENRSRVSQKIAYVGQHQDQQIVKESTSGGAFTALAEVVLAKNGVVYGAALDQNLHVRHIGVSKKEDLKAFRNSKYVQSEIGSCLSQVKNDLVAGKKVLFSGTPCQIAGVLNYLGKAYDNLYCVDVVCRAVPSPLVLNKYLEMRLGENADRTHYSICFRDKKHGYEYPTLVIYDKLNQKEICRDGIDSDPYLRSFFSGTSIRPSCTACVFRSCERRSDITLWDCFDVSRYPNTKQIDNNRGVTHILVHSDKGIALLKEAEKCGLTLIEIDAGKAIESAREMRISHQRHQQHIAFFDQLQMQPPQEVFTRFFPRTAKVNIEKAARLACHKLGIYRLAKKAYLKITGFQR